MTKLTLLLISFIPAILQAQFSQGVISYDEVTQLDLNFKAEGIDMEQIKSLVPSSNTSKRELVYTSEHSIYRTAENTEESEDNSFSSTSGDVSINIVRSGNKSELYSNLQKHSSVEKRDFMGRVFLISGNQDEYKWKIGTETKEILKYKCQKAILQKDSTEVIAWFSTQIPIPAGPNGYGNLPGMILEMSINDGKTVITATDVKFGNQKTAEIKPPKKGKSVSRDEFNEIVKEKMKEMGEMRGGNTVIRVIEGQ